MATVELAPVGRMHPPGDADAGPIRLLVADDRPVFARSLATALSHEDDIEVVAAGPLEDLLPSLIFDDLCLVLISITSGVRSLVQDLPESMTERRVLVLADSHDRALMDQLLAIGIRGIVDQSASMQVLVNALRTVGHGQSALPGHVLDHFMNRARPARLRPALDARPGGCALSPREIGILDLLSAGRGTRQIAEELFLSISTVRSHVQNILGKLGAHSRLEAVARGRDLGLVGHRPKAG